jgi:hypothetical protein
MKQDLAFLKMDEIRSFAGEKNPQGSHSYLVDFSL